MSKTKKQAAEHLKKFFELSIKEKANGPSTTRNLKTMMIIGAKLNPEAKKLLQPLVDAFRDHPKKKIAYNTRPSGAYAKINNSAFKTVSADSIGGDCQGCTSKELLEYEKRKRAAMLEGYKKDLKENPTASLGGMFTNNTIKELRAYFNYDPNFVSDYLTKIRGNMNIILMEVDKENNPLSEAIDMEVLNGDDVNAIELEVMDFIQYYMEHCKQVETIM